MAVFIAADFPAMSPYGFWNLVWFLEATIQNIVYYNVFLHEEDPCTKPTLLFMVWD